jgi:hypothetical protein
MYSSHLKKLGLNLKSGFVYLKPYKYSKLKRKKHVLLMLYAVCFALRNSPASEEESIQQSEHGESLKSRSIRKNKN